jgi:hypothetical protein
MFGTSPIRPPSFGEILDDLGAEARLGRGEAVRTGRSIQPDLDWFFQLLAMAAKPESGGRGAGSASRDAYGERTREITPPPDDEDAVAAELALSDVGSLKELKELRRAFALRNHPDLLHPAVQAWATRMKIANMLIDRRVKELARAG